jgi:predicted aspartyl protease
VGTVFFDDQEITILVIGGEEIANVLMGLQWLKTLAFLCPLSEW